MAPFAIGVISRLVGSASVSRPNGGVVRLKVGDHVSRDDVIETTADGQVCVCFIDNTIVSLSNNARMVLAQFPCDGNSHKALLEVTRGDFYFCGGSTARTGLLEIGTPFANIRGHHRAGGFATLSLVSLFLSLIDEVNASPPNAAAPDDDDQVPVDYKDQPHGSFELVTKEVTPRRFFVDDPGTTWAFRLTGTSELSVTQISNPPARMQELSGIQQSVQHMWAVGLAAMQGPTVNGQNGSTTNPNFEILPGNARPINFSPSGSDSSSTTTTTVTNSGSSGALSRTTGTTSPEVNSDTTVAPAADALFVPPAAPPSLPPLPPSPVPPAAPVITTTSPPQNSASSIDITGTAEPSATVTLLNNGAPVAATTADSSGSWTINGIALTNGASYNFTAIATNAVSSTSAPSNALVFHDQQIPPTIAITSPIAGDNVVNATEASAGFAISGTTTGIADGQTATIVIVNSANAVVATYTPTVTGNAWTLNVTPGQAQGLANGSYTVKADVSDQAGNAASEATQSLTVSTAALSITITSPIAGDNVVNATEAAAGFAISGTTTGIADGQTATITIVNSANAVLFTFNPVVSGNAWSVTVPGSDHLADGSYTVRADVSDQFGNHAPEASQPLTVDETAPTAPAVALTGDTGTSNSDHITNNPALALSSIEPGAKVEYSLDGGTTWSTSAPTAAQLAQGANTVDVRQTDVAGNVSAVTAFTFTLDTVAPTIAITSPIAGDNVVNATEASAGFAISGTTTGIADGQTATIVIVNSANAVVATYTPTVTGNAWTLNVTPGQAQGLANGSYTVKADVSIRRAMRRAKPPRA